MTRFVALAAALMMTIGVLPGSAPAQAQAPERVVNVFNWNDYIDPYMVQRFTRETGIRVRYDVFDALETLEARMLVLAR